MIYFVRSGDYVKIGYTQHPQDKISVIGTSCPERIEVLLIINGTREDETVLHEFFKSDHHNREWFKFTAKVVKFIRDNQGQDRRYEFGFIHGFDFEEDEQIHRLRLSHKMTLAELGNKLGITAQSVKEMETREFSGAISLKILKKVAKALGYKFEYRFYPLKEIQERAQATMDLERAVEGRL